MTEMKAGIPPEQRETVISAIDRDANLAQLSPSMVEAVERGNLSAKSSEALREASEALPEPRVPANPTGAVPEGAIQKLQPTNNNASKVETAASTAVAEQPVAAIDVTDSVDSMLPSCERLQAVYLDEAPESVLERSRVQDPSTRPSILCIDARTQSVDIAENWLRTFYALISRQVVDGDSSETLPWTPAIVVALPIGVQSLSNEWAERSDIDWLLSHEDDVNVCDLYLNAMRKRLTRFLSGVPVRTSGPPQQERLVLFGDILTEEQRRAWATTIESDQVWNDY